MDYTGPTLLNGPELSKAASEALGVDMKFEDISEYAYLPTYLPTYMKKCILTKPTDAKQNKS